MVIFMLFRGIGYCGGKTDGAFRCWKLSNQNDYLEKVGRFYSDEDYIFDIYKYICLEYLYL